MGGGPGRYDDSAKKAESNIGRTEPEDETVDDYYKSVSVKGDDEDEIGRIGGTDKKAKEVDNKAKEEAQKRGEAKKAAALRKERAENEATQKKAEHERRLGHDREEAAKRKKAVDEEVAKRKKAETGRRKDTEGR